MRTASVLLLALALTGCAQAAPSASPSSIATWSDAGTLVLPPTTGAADYQLGGAYPPPAGVSVVARDSTERPAEGVYGICYVNGFQSQPQDRRLWLDARQGLFVTKDGEPVIDPNWPDELILDTSTAAKREQLLAIMRPTIEGCATAGFRAIEFDNLDSFTRTEGALTDSDNAAMATAYVAYAHELGLAVAQKNTAEYANRWKTEVGFDFVVAEECVRYDECASYTGPYGDHVIDIEYTDDLVGSVGETCATPSRPPMTIVRDRDLVTPDDAAYVYEAC
jgi:hypothetical protein